MSVYLVDTHVFLWSLYEPERLPARIQKLFETDGNDFLLSKVSVWEIAIKLRSGKMTTHKSLELILKDQSDMESFVIEDISLQDVLAVQHLEVVHKDPFDHLLVAQAKIRNIPIISADRKFANYPVEVIWE